MSAQLNIDFENIVHVRENNAENQKHLDENREKFNRQCKQVYDLLKSGKRLTRLGAANEYGIASLERRCADLRAAGIEVKSEWIIIDGKRSHKEYYL